MGYTSDVTPCVAKQLVTFREVRLLSGLPTTRPRDAGIAELYSVCRDEFVAGSFHWILYLRGTAYADKDGDNVKE